MDKLQPHQVRVVVEKDELYTKLQALRKFVDVSPAFLSVDPEEQERLKTQCTIMGMYLNILNQRISAFK